MELQIWLFEAGISHTAFFINYIGKALSLDAQPRKFKKDVINRRQHPARKWGSNHWFKAPLV